MASDRSQDRMVVIGGGGHAKVVIELLRERPDALEVVGVIDADPSPRTVLGVPVLGDDTLLSSLRAQGVSHAFVAVGDNRLRQRLGAQVRSMGFDLVNAISPRAAVSPSARIGVGVAVMAGAVVNADARLGDLVIVNSGAVVDHDVLLGRAAHVGPGCALAGGVLIGPRAFLGVGVSVIPGVRIGGDTIVGAGATVIADLWPRVLAVGAPARVVRSLQDPQ